MCTEYFKYTHFLVGTDSWLKDLDNLKEHAISKYTDPIYKKIIGDLCEKIKDAETNKQEWEGFSIIKSIYEDEGKSKYTLIGRAMKVTDDDNNWLEFSIERI